VTLFSLALRFFAVSNASELLSTTLLAGIQAMLVFGEGIVARFHVGAYWRTISVDPSIKDVGCGGYTLVCKSSGGSFLCSVFRLSSFASFDPLVVQRCLEFKQCLDSGRVLLHTTRAFWSPVFVVFVGLSEARKARQPVFWSVCRSCSFAVSPCRPWTLSL
jgi:hypothetical protein